MYVKPQWSTYNFSISHLYIIQQTGSENIQTWVTKVEFLPTTLNNIKQNSKENEHHIQDYLLTQFQILHTHIIKIV